MHQASGNRNTLFLPPRQRARFVMDAMFEAQTGEHLDAAAIAQTPAALLEVVAPEQAQDFWD